MLLLRDSAVYYISVGCSRPDDKVHENTLTAHRRERGGFYRPPRPAVFENEKKNHNEHLHRLAVPVVKIPHAFTPASAREHRASTRNVGNNSVDNNTEHARDAHFLPRREESDFELVRHIHLLYTCTQLYGGNQWTRTHTHTHTVLFAYSYSNLNFARTCNCIYVIVAAYTNARVEFLFSPLEFRRNTVDGVLFFIFRHYA